MREYDALKDYPQPEARIVGDRDIHCRIIASYRGRLFFDGDREFGYGGMIDDGRWKPVAEIMHKHYRLNGGSIVWEINSEKGYLLGCFKAIGCNVLGIETSAYARRHSVVPTVPRPPQEGHCDLLIARGAVYTGNLAEAIQCLRWIEARAHASFITLAAYESDEDLRLMRKWSLLGTTILKPDEWREVMAHAGYTGDYSFVTARTLRLREPS